MDKDASDSLAPSILVIVWTFFAIGGIFIFLRIFARLRKETSLWWDDFLIIFSWLCLGATAICQQHATTHGLGRHAKYISQEDVSHILRSATVVGSIFAIATSVWSKVSFALSLLRISSSGCTEITRKIIWGVIISLNLLFVVAAVMLLANCRPMEKIWRPGVEGKCWSQETSILGAVVVAAYSGVADLILAFLPWKIIWCLPIVRREKICLIVVMSFGVFAGIVSFIKCAQIGLMITQDFTYESWMLIFWAFFEPTLTIIAASLPVVRVLFRDQLRTTRYRRGLGNADPENAGGNVMLGYMTNEYTSRTEEKRSAESSCSKSCSEVVVRPV